jgi:UDP-glucose-4-epimerase GalE
LILVTGGAGYIGSHTVRALREAGHEPLVFDDFSTGHRDFVGDAPLCEGDLRRPADIRKAFRDHAIDGVIHFAGKALVGESVEDPGLYYRSNLVAGLNLLEAMAAARVRRLIFSSTCATYGVPTTENLDESHPQAPINPYGESKLAMERAIRWFHQAHGISWLSLRYFNAAGADPAGRSGEDHQPETHLIPLVLEAAAGLRPEVRVFGTDYPTPDGTCIRDYIHVVDLAQAHVVGLRGLLAGELEPQALNLGTGEGASVREVVEVCRRVVGREFPVVDAGRRAGDPPRLVAAVDRARAALGWSPGHSGLEEIVRTAWDWMARRRGLAA